MTATSAIASTPLILQDSRSKLYYNRDLGGFSESDSSKATQLDNAAQVAFIKAHFARPEFIEAVPAPAAAPSPDNAHFNPHINGTLRPRKTHHGRDGSRSYRFGDYRIELTISRTSRSQGCGYRKTTTSTNFDLINHARGEHSYLNSGGLRAALAAVIKQEMKRHGLA